MQLRSLQEFINELSAEMYCRDHWGTPASYIPELSTVAPAQFGITVVLDDGKIASAGESEKKFSIQSVSKIVLLSIALGRIGDALWTRVGREPSGMSFDSIVQLEHENGRPRNPFLMPVPSSRRMHSWKDAPQERFSRRSSNLFELLQRMKISISISE